MISKDFELFGLEFHWYGLILGFSVLVVFSIGSWAASKLYPNGEITKSTLDESFWWVLVFGLLGARLYHVVDYREYYSLHTNAIWAVWNGGLGIYGGVLGIVIGVFAWSLKERFVGWVRMFWGLLDVLSIGALLGQAIGRIGNYLNQELYGSPTTLPWKIFISPEKRMKGYESVSYYHPLFLYESLWNLIGFYFLYRMAAGRYLHVGKGNYLLVYLFWYALGRTWLEYFRIEVWMVGQVPMASLIGVFILLVSLLIFWFRKKNNEWTVLAD